MFNYKTRNLSRNGFMAFICLTFLAFLIHSSETFAEKSKANKNAKNVESKTSEQLKTEVATTSNNSQKKYNIKKCLVEFATVGSPQLIKINGKSNKSCEGYLVIQSDGQVSESALKMNLTDIDTGIALRNRHLRENYLKTNEFPEAQLKIKKLEQFESQIMGKSNQKSDFIADLTLKGQSAPVMNPKYQITQNKASAEFDVDLPEHKIERPSFMGVKIIDKVHIIVSLDFE